MSIMTNECYKNDTKLQNQEDVSQPSYVNLSCTVSGYSNHIRYTSPNSKMSPPSQIPVSSPTKVLVTSVSNEEERMMGNDFVGKDEIDRAPCKDANMSPGTLVQKQIERLYGGKVHSVRKSISPSAVRNPEIDTASFSLSPAQSAFRSPNSLTVSPSTPKKIPAVFRLLRPEFQEQLKASSCQIPKDRTSVPSPSPKKNLGANVERSPSTTRIIPVIKEPRTFAEMEKSENGSCGRSEDDTSITNPAEAPLLAKRHVNGHHSPIGFETINEDEVLETYERVGGVHAIGELTTIPEEDVESGGSAAQNENISQQIDKNVRDGHYFIKLLENEIFKFEEYICDFEEELSNEAIPADVRDMILAAIGKAKLLMAQKLAQFRGLCEKNISVSIEEDPFVPQPQDLEGFWDMVYIQVEHIHSLFVELSQLRQNGWQKKEVEKQNGNGTNSPVEKKTITRTKKVHSKTAATKGSSNAAKVRNEARKKMLEEKKRQMRQKMMEEQSNAKQENGETEMFVKI